MADATLAELQDRLTKLEEAAGADSYGTTNNYFISQKEATKILEEIEAILGPIFRLMHASPPAIATSEHPEDIAITPDGQNVYVASQKGKNIDIYNRDENGVLTLNAHLAAPAELKRLAMAPSGDLLYVISFTHVYAYEILEGGGLNLLKAAALTETAPNAAHANEEGVFIANREKIERFTPTLEKLEVLTPHVGEEIFALAESADGKNLYALGAPGLAEACKIHVYTIGEKLALVLLETVNTLTYHAGRVTIAVHPTDRWLYTCSVPSEGGAEIGQFNRAATGALTAMNPAKIAFGAGGPIQGSMVLRPDGRGVYVTNFNTGNLYEMPITRLTGNIQYGELETITPAGAGPEAMAFTPDSKNLYVLCREANEMACLAGQ